MMGNLSPASYPSGFIAHTRAAMVPLSFINQAKYDANSPVEVVTSAHRLRMSMSGFDQWMVWNPRTDGARRVADLPDDDWRSFVCVEPVIVSRPNRLAHGQTFAGILLAETLHAT